jgi:hypothetical protein
MIRIRTLPALAAFALASAAGAQQSPPSPPSGDAAVPKHSCTKPGDVPGNLTSDTQRRVWNKEYLAYGECLKKFIAEQKALADPHLKAYNATVDEYNESVKTINEQVEKVRSQK